MAEKRYAVLIANNEFPGEPGLQDLRLPLNDADGMNAALSSDRSEFADITVLKNTPSYEILVKLNQVLNQAERDALVLVYYSGHGKLNSNNQLHLATHNTVLSTLESTSVPVHRIKEFMDVSPANKTVLLLDCCYSGAAGSVFAKGSVDDQLQIMAGGRGTYIMTASTGVQVAQENEADEYGIFTKHLIGGLQGDDADENGDGLISMDELYSYVRKGVRLDGAQEPMKWDLNVSGGELFVARSGRAPREERRIQLRQKLYELGGQNLLPDSIVQTALNVLTRETGVLSESDREYDALLDMLVREPPLIGDFIQNWMRVQPEQVQPRRATTPEPVPENPVAGGLPRETAASSPTPQVRQEPAAPKPQPKSDLRIVDWRRTSVGTLVVGVLLIVILRIAGNYWGSEFLIFSIIPWFVASIAGVLGLGIWLGKDSRTSGFLGAAIAGTALGVFVPLVVAIIYEPNWVFDAYEVPFWIGNIVPKTVIFAIMGTVGGVIGRQMRKA